MPQETYSRIKRRFIMSVGLVLALLAMLFCGHTLSERRLVVSGSESRAASYASALREHAERLFTEADNHLQSLVEDIGEHGGIAATQSERFYRHLRTTAQSGPQFSSVFVVDASGRIIAHSQQYRMPPVDVSDRDYFLKHRTAPGSGTYISKTFTSRVSGTSRFCVSRPLTDSSGAFAGLVAVTFETSYFEGFYKTLDVGRDGRIILTTTSGDILVNEPRFDKPFAMDFKTSPLFSTYLPAAPHGTHQVVSPITNTMRLMSYSALSRFPVVAIVSLGMEDVLVTWRQSLYKHGGIVLLLMGGVGLLSRLFLRQFTRLEQANAQLESQAGELQIANISIEKVLDPVYWMTEDARIWKVNAAACAALGYERDELVGMTIPDIDPLMTPELWTGHWRDLQQKGSVKLETQHRLKSGSVIDVEVVANLVACGGQQFNCAIVRDITERKEADRRLAAVAREWQNTFDSVEDAVWLLDMDRQIIRANVATWAIFGKTVPEVVGVRCCDIVHDDKMPHEACPFERMLDSGKRATMQLRLGSRWYEVTLDPVFDEAGRICNAVHVVKDITELKKAEEREHIRSEILERIARGERLSLLLAFIATAIEKERPGALCSILLVSSDHKRLLTGAAPSLPEAFNMAVNRTRIGEGIGSCGTAAFRRERVVVEDIATHPFWKGFTPAEEAGLRSCWSEPIVSSGGKLLGTFAIYHREPASPGEEEIRLIEQASAFAGIAIERSRNEAERRELEEQLHQSQKMEAIGYLAGGMAHDFNNLLTPIIVCADLLKGALPKDDDKARLKLETIAKASHKARDLTLQLLSFGRKQIMHLQPTDLNEIVTSFHTMLRRTLRENIEITLRLSPQAPPVNADRQKIEQILLNLAINAQDAIESHGTIAIETGLVLVDDEFARRHPDMQPGNHVLLTFRDSGCGMDEKTVSRIFEPFFTTKQPGHGTGLGLANVYGIVSQHNGHIEVQSTPGKGTAFLIYFPITQQEAVSSESANQRDTGDHRGSETILLAEDNDMVRSMAIELLEALGYVVYGAAHPQDAVELARKLPDRIDLLITDVVMPGMNGQELYEALKAERPDMGPVLYMSGYTNNLTVDGALLEENDNFLPKPFTVEIFMAKVKELLQGQCRPEAASSAARTDRNETVGRELQT